MCCYCWCCFYCFYWCCCYCVYSYVRWKGEASVRVNESRQPNFWQSFSLEIRGDCTKTWEPRQHHNYGVFTCMCLVLWREITNQPLRRGRGWGEMRRHRRTRRRGRVEEEEKRKMAQLAKQGHTRQKLVVDACSITFPSFLWSNRFRGVSNQLLAVRLRHSYYPLSLPSLSPAAALSLPLQFLLTLSLTRILVFARKCSLHLEMHPSFSHCFHWTFDTVVIIIRENGVLRVSKKLRQRERQYGGVKEARDGKFNDSRARANDSRTMTHCGEWTNFNS